MLCPLAWLNAGKKFNNHLFRGQHFKYSYFKQATQKPFFLKDPAPYMQKDRHYFRENLVKYVFPQITSVFSNYFS